MILGKYAEGTTNHGVLADGTARLYSQLGIAVVVYFKGHFARKRAFVAAEPRFRREVRGERLKARGLYRYALNCFYVVRPRASSCASRTSSTRGGGAAFARGRVVVVNSFYLFLSNDNFDFCFLVYLVSSFPQPPLTTLVVSNTA